MRDKDDKENDVVKITKKSKYKRIDAWGESSGELSYDEMAALLYYDAIDTFYENLELLKREYLVFSESELNQIYENEKLEERLQFAFTKEDEEKFKLI